MSESVQHLQLVSFLKKKVMSITPSDCWCCIQDELPDSLNHPPITLEGFRPDIYYHYKNLLIIGEAKTNKDVSRKHSRAQYESYIKECSAFSGEAFMFLAVPWLEEAEAHNILRSIKKKHPGPYTTKVFAWIDGEE